MRYLEKESRAWKRRQALRRREVLLGSRGLVATPILSTYNMATLEEQVAELARQLAELRGASAVAPSVATVST